jgi:hypothetical protein
MGCWWLTDGSRGGLARSAAMSCSPTMVWASWAWERCGAGARGAPLLGEGGARTTR